MQIEQRHINSVQPYIRNARVIKDKAIDKVVADGRTFEQVAYDRTEAIAA